MKDGWYWVILDGHKVIASFFVINENGYWHFGEDPIIDETRITEVMDYVGPLE